MAEVVELAEYGTREVPDRRLADEDRPLVHELAADRRLLFDELRDGLRIRASEWVGVVRLRELEIRVRPKLAGATRGLVDMLEFTDGITALRRLEAERTIDAVGDRLVDVVVTLLVDGCEALVRAGLRTDYLQREEPLAFLRGRLLLTEQLRHRHGMLDQLWCRYDEREFDTPDNQLLGLALRRALRVTESPALRRRVLQMATVFEEVCRPEALVATWSTHRFAYDRLNRRYSEPHAVARVLLQGLALNDLLTGGRRASYAFLIDMNALFERVVEGLVRAALAGDDTTVERQSTTASIVRWADTGHTAVRLRPDVLARVGEGEVVPVDAKYKALDGGAPDAADVAQLFLYAHAYGRRPHAVLVYPCDGDRPIDRGLVCRTGPAGGVLSTVGVLGVPIRAAIAEARAGSGEVLARLRSAIRAA